MYFVDMEKASDRVPRLVMKWAMRKKALSEVMVWEVMSSYDGAKKRVRVGSAYSEEFKVKVGGHQGSVLSPLLFAVVVDVITKMQEEVRLTNYCMQIERQRMDFVIWETD